MSPTLLVILAAILWSAGGVGVKSSTMQAASLAGWRSLFAIPVLLLATFFAQRGTARSVVSALKSPRVWIGAASYALMVTCYVLATKRTTAANAILIQYTGPIYVALLSYPLLREKLRAVDWGATLVCIVGMVLFFFDKVSTEGKIGNAIAILSSLGFAGVPLMMRLEHRKESDSTLAPALTLLLGNAITALVTLPFMIEAPPDTAANLFIAVALGFFQIGLAYWFYSGAVGKMPALRSSLLATIEPILNPLWVLVVTGERPGKWAFVGGAVILAAVTMQARYRLN